ncbi:MAG: hypothetical protein LN415_09800, partial [Candidatus Thermoplasmatota archaeon]|nr:hypothetical protein [Candidatus Thermoplasmatota archaeon]
MTCFERLDQLLKEQNIDDAAGYILAQVKCWDGNLYPPFLLTDNALYTYQRYREARNVIVVRDEDYRNEEATLQALCDARKEEPEEVLYLLKDTGIFSSEFIDHKERADGTSTHRPDKKGKKIPTED